MSVEDVTTDAFAGRLYRPLGPKPHAGVLVLRGSDPSAGFTKNYARHLAMHGYAALRVQYVGLPDGPDGFDMRSNTAETILRARVSPVQRGATTRGSVR